MKKRRCAVQTNRAGAFNRHIPSQGCLPPAILWSMASRIRSMIRCPSRRWSACAGVPPLNQMPPGSMNEGQPVSPQVAPADNTAATGTSGAYNYFRDAYDASGNSVPPSGGAIFGWGCRPRRANAFACGSAGTAFAGTSTGTACSAIAKPAPAPVRTEPSPSANPFPAIRITRMKHHAGGADSSGPAIIAPLAGNLFAACFFARARCSVGGNIA